MTSSQAGKSAPTHLISIEPNPSRVIARIAGTIIADTRDALTLREAGQAPVHYIPRTDVNMSALKRTDRATFCPRKGDCSYFGILSGPRDGSDTRTAWSYENPHPSVIAIRDHIAFDPGFVEFVEES